MSAAASMWGWDGADEVERPAASRFCYDGAAAGRARKAGLSRRRAGGRPLPMEEVILFRKSFDNSRVRRPVDPADKRSWLRTVGVLAMLLLLAIVALGPRAWLRHSGYRQAELSERRMELQELERHLQVRHAQLTDLRRVGRVAAAMGLEAPPPEHYAWQDLTVNPTTSEPTLAETFAEPHVVKLP
ncbi:MAG: hypothetical protein GC160_08670 [Acidobacteria bacterium]|nr:hypothetical protein [Acidobacteriota bacterium]